MKTIADLNALIPTLVELIRNNDHEIGESYYEQDEDGWGRCDDSTTNYLCYEEDGWLIEVTYECCGEWDNDPAIIGLHRAAILEEHGARLLKLPLPTTMKI